MRAQPFLPRFRLHWMQLCKMKMRYRWMPHPLKVLQAENPRPGLRVAGNQDPLPPPQETLHLSFTHSLGGWFPSNPAPLPGWEQPCLLREERAQYCRDDLSLNTEPFPRGGVIASLQISQLNLPEHAGPDLALSSSGKCPLISISECMGKVNCKVQVDSKNDHDLAFLLSPLPSPPPSLSSSLASSSHQPPFLLNNM